MGFGGFKSKFATSKVDHAEGGESFVVDTAQSTMRTASTGNRTDQTAANVLSPLVDDEVSSRLLASVVSIVEDRQQLAGSLDEHKRYLRETERSMEELKNEKKTAQMMLERKDEEIESVHRLVAEKQLKYDQLLEDYKQLRANDAKEYERLQQQIKEIRLNYENLNADYGRFRAESLKENQKLEAEVRDGLVKYHQLLDEYNKLREENARLTGSIINFTQQMSTLRVPETPSTVERNPVPIQPVVSGPGEPEVHR